MTELAMAEPIASSVPPPLIVHPHALTGDGRIDGTAAFLPRETLGRYMERNNIAIPRGPFHTWHNGRRVPADLWDRLIPRAGDQIILRSQVLGGGGGDGSKVLRTVALVALAISAPYIAGYMQGLAWGTAATGFGGALLTAGIMVGGSILITPLLPEVTQ